LIVNDKHDRWAISPSLQFFPNGAYGYPLQTPGVDPLSCTGSLASAVKGDPRYPYGAPGGLPYDAMTCAKTLLAIPDSYTGRFDDESEFQQPNLVVVNAQIEYQASPNVSYVFNAANLVNRCLGGSREPWTAYADSRVCFYGGNAYGILPPTGNIYNPGATFQPQVQFPYQQYFGTQPLNLYLNVKIKL
jgi:hypothetical protein